jgi:C4-dicarboxylate-specific signal transduction histidine kinase
MSGPCERRVRFGRSIILGKVKTAPRKRFPALLLLTLLTTTICLPAARAEDTAPIKRVLVLTPFQRSRSASETFLRGIEEAAKTHYQGYVEVVAEDISAVPPEPWGFERKVSDWLAYKYGGQHFDAIVSVIAPSLPFAVSLRDRFWPDAPILLVLQEEDRAFFPKAVPHSARVIIALSSAATVRSALQMLPSTRHLVFLEGSSEQDKRGNAEILGHIRQAFPNLDIIEIGGLSWEETKARVGSLPENSIVLMGAFFFDRNYHEMSVPEQVAQLTQEANAPILTDNDESMGKGELGGSVSSVRGAGLVAGSELAELLKGADPDKMPARMVQNTCMVDWREMQRWGISKNRLPENTTVLFKPPTGWEQYKKYIIATAIVLTMLLALIAFLLVERTRRRKEEELNEAMLKSLPGLALLVSAQGEILRTNQADDGGIGEAFTRGARRGRKYEDYLRDVAGADDVAVHVIGQVVAGARASATAEVALAPGHRWMEVRAIRLPQGQKGTLVVHLDITQRKQAELERTRSRTEIYHLNRVAAMGQLAASLAHELSQPLAAIMSNAEAAQRFAGRADPDMVEIREALDDITRDDKRARGVIQGMRAMLKKEDVTIEPVDLNQIAASVVQMVRNEATLRGMRIELALRPSAVMVKGDQVGLEQVVLNLASNGLDAMTDTIAERCLTIRTEVEANAGVIWVIDDGPGVSPELREKLFQPFFTTKHTGLGMGLSICQSILESLGGRIDMKNHDGKGAAFFVTLPLA